ncbi:hypothetical protein AWW66_11600 [Micromonospora rosaria]|uniref:Uncharacterized protein n=1 Tax=Micromonospora rosaria TaxID=47874 RepID=A0A136PTT1_9ACTN|nr:hypothetical protein [Micromonospora rosaria]KXK61822.1 hypothetical protein AWW66_11600 [Micromonospora rosaria]
MDDIGPRGLTDGRRAARTLRTLAGYVEGVVAVILLVGREDVGAYAGVLPAVLRCAAELLEGPSER